MRSRPGLSVLVTALALALTAVACGSSGRDLRPPESNAVSPTRSTASTLAPLTLPSTLVPGTVPGAGGTAVPGTGVPGSGVPGVGSTHGLSLSSTSFTDGGTIPTELSCTGPSPALSWDGVPAGTAELALVVNDPDASAQGFVHWLVVGIPPQAGSVAKGEVPTGASQLANGAGKASWFGPCPPPGKPHTYRFTLYALPAAYSARSGTPANTVADELAARSSASSTITGTFGR